MPSEILEYDSKSYTEPSPRESRRKFESLDSVEIANDKHELRAQRKSLTPENILYCVDLQLTGDADRWIQQTVFFRRMLEATSTATEADFIRFEEAFKSRFPNTTVVCEVDIHAKLAKLQQEFDESLSEYSSRATSLLHEFGVKDQVAGVELSAIEAGTLNRIKFKYIYMASQVRSSG
ncbi:hypothetical protein GcM3_192043 [Golovinomyces cichoracearum]|uniref:Retrotransposon gag domain-containing protein n=1 Tax=Golovinomyces cichoracearum TaxID=62708 RepID=A0A420HH70_9PEZI|nr:hypothetical protein GcM3_192043 [Golovinomyces cichoracearum]